MNESKLKERQTISICRLNSLARRPARTDGRRSDQGKNEGYGPHGISIHFHHGNVLISQGAHGVLSVGRECARNRNREDRQRRMNGTKLARWHCRVRYRRRRIIDVMQAA